MDNNFYPERENLYALHYVQWLIKAGIASEIGPSAFGVLVAVAMTEDELWYTRPPTFWNDQLARAAGIGSEPAFIRARTRAEEAGLLVYKQGRVRGPGTYFTQGMTNDSLAMRESSVSHPLVERESSVSHPLVERLPSNPIPEPRPKPKPKPRPNKVDIDRPDDVSEQTWGDWLSVRKAKRAGPVTTTAINATRREATKVGMTLEDAIATCVRRAWVGFEAAWLGDGSGTKTFAKQRTAGTVQAIEDFANG